MTRAALPAAVMFLCFRALADAQGFLPAPEAPTERPKDARPADAPDPLKPTLDVQLKGALTPLLVKHRVPAVAVAVFDSESVLGKAAMGLRARGFPDSVTTADLWHIGSCTKAFTATVVGSLVESGKLKWDTTLAEALPESAPTMHADFKRVTLRQLLRHRAGLAPFTAGNAPEFNMLKGLQGDTRAQRAAFVTALLGSEPTNKPDTKLVYSNASYAVAAAIAEAAADQTYEALLRDRVFDRVAMPLAGLGWPATPARRDEPRGHLPGILGARPQDLDPQYKFNPVLAPAGDIHCTIEDFARFAAAHMKGLRENIPAIHPKPGTAPPGTPGTPGTPTRLRLLKPETVLELHAPIDGYAGGWVIAENQSPPRHWHNGSAGTFYALMVIIPERNIGAVAISNAGDAEPACTEIVQTALDLCAN